jgi:hypothetical protein
MSSRSSAQSPLQSWAILILVLSLVVGSSAALALLVLSLLIEPNRLHDWAIGNHTIQQMSPIIRWSIAHLHLIAVALLVWSSAGVSTAVGLLKVKSWARYGVWLWVAGMVLWSGWNIAILWAIPSQTGPQAWQIAAAQQQQLTMLLSYALMGGLNGLALLLLWRCERYFSTS